MVGTNRIAGDRRLERTIGACAGTAFGCVLVCFATATVALAQYQAPPEQKSLNEKGIINGVQGPLVTAKLENGDWVLATNAESIVRVSGTAEPDYLHPGVTIKFSGEVDKKGVLQKELDAVEIFTPKAKGGLGVFENGSDEAKAVPKAVDGTTYEFRGKVASYKPGELTLSVGGKKIIAKTAAGLNVAVNTSDLSLAQEGDNITITGWYTDAEKPDANQMQPGYAAVTTMTITLSKPLAPSKKARPTSSKAPRPAKTPPAAAPKEPTNPFAN